MTSSAPAGLLKAAAVGPPLLFSTFLTMGVGSLLPNAVALAVFVACLAGTVAAATPVGEAWWVRAMCQARPMPTPTGAHMQHVEGLLSQAGVVPPGISLWVVRDRRWYAHAVGRRSVICSSGMIEAVQTQQLAPLEAAATLTHAVARLRGGYTRWDVLIEWWTLPWNVVAAFVGGFARGLGRLPLVALAWRARWLFGAVAVAQSLMLRTPAGTAVAVGQVLVVGATYAVPGWRRAWQRRLGLLGDGIVIEHGFGPALATVLRRTSPATAPGLADRVGRLTAQPTSVQDGPRLRLVTSTS